GSDFAHHLRAHVLELVLELDLLGDGDAVLGDAGCAERFVEHDVAPLGAERHLDRVVQNVDAAQHAVAGIDAEFEFFGWHVCFPLVDLCSSSKNEMSWVFASSFEMPAAPAPQDEEAGVRLKRPFSWWRCR